MHQTNVRSDAVQPARRLTQSQIAGRQGPWKGILINRKQNKNPLRRSSSVCVKS